jgi:hypothetical protein
MIVHADNAKFHWCPFTGNSPQTTRGIISSNCLGPECMAWRWIDTDIDDSDGYCGLAGPPRYDTKIDYD